MIDFVWHKNTPFREFRDIRQLTKAEKQQTPKYLKPADLRKKAIEAWHPKTYKGKFSEWNYKTKQLEITVKCVRLWDFSFKLMAIFRVEIASSKNFDAKNFLTSHICMNEGYDEGFCCRLATIMCHCMAKACSAGHGINAAWICCKFNPVQCAIVHNVFHRHDLVSNCEERNDVAPEGYIVSQKTGK